MKSIALLGLAALALAGCSTEGDVLARVGTQTIRKGDFEAAANMLANRYPGVPDSAKAHLLRDLVDRELLVQGAVLEGLYRDTTFLDYRRRVEEQLLRQRYYDELGTSDVVVSPAEIAELHRWREEERAVQIVYTFTEPMARAALAQIHGGADFATVANRFNPGGYTPPGGDLGYVQPGMLQLPLDDVIRFAPVGQVQGPIETIGQGWFLVLVKDRRKAEPKSLEQERNLLVSILRQRKQREILVKALAHLRADYHVTVARGGAQSLIAYVVPPSLKGEQPPPLTLVQSAEIVATYDGGSYTMGDAIQDLSAGTVQRPNFNQAQSVERWIEMRALERVALVEARRRQLDQQPEVLRTVRERLNDYLLEGYITREVLERTNVTEADERAVFDQVSARPDRLQEATFEVVVLRDSATAAQLATSAPQAEGLREAVSLASLGVQVKKQTVQYPTSDFMGKALEGPLMATAPGGYTPAIPISGAWAVAHLLSKNVVPQTFETLAPELRTMVENAARERKRGILLTALSDSLRREIPIQVHYERLKGLAWPMLPGLPAGIQG